MFSDKSTFRQNCLLLPKSTKSTWFIGTKLGGKEAEILVVVVVVVVYSLKSKRMGWKGVFSWERYSSLRTPEHFRS